MTDPTRRRSFISVTGEWLGQPGELTAGQKVIVELATLLVLAAIVLPISIFFTQISSPTTGETDLVVRIESLSRALTSASGTIAEIEKEVNQRRALVDRLKRDAEVASQLAALHKEQADAIAQTLRLQLEADQKVRFWVSIAQSAVFLILGLGLGELYRYVRVRLRRRRNRTSQGE